MPRWHGRQSTTRLAVEFMNRARPWLPCCGRCRRTSPSGGGRPGYAELSLSRSGNAGDVGMPPQLSSAVRVGDALGDSSSQMEVQRGRDLHLLVRGGVARYHLGFRKKGRERREGRRARKKKSTTRACDVCLDSTNSRLHRRTRGLPRPSRDVPAERPRRGARLDVGGVWTRRCGGRPATASTDPGVSGEACPIPAHQVVHELPRLRWTTASTPTAIVTTVATLVVQASIGETARRGNARLIPVR